MRQFLALLWLGGCTAIYGLDATDVAHPLDSDGDGILDADDNCPQHANPTQNDEDDDTLGDVCDNCPLVFNPDQRNVGDTDAIGDRCDPHPTDSTDCLRLFDSFDDDFATYWRVGGDPGGKPERGDGFVTLTPNGATQGISLLAPDLTGRFDVQIRGSGEVGKVLAVSNLTSLTSGAGCGARLALTSYEILVESYPAAGGDDSLRSPIEPQIGTSLLFQLTNDSEVGTTCRIELGAERELRAIGHRSVYPAGNPGAIAVGNPLALHGIAIYEQGGACPPPVYR